MIQCFISVFSIWYASDAIWYCLYVQKSDLIVRRPMQCVSWICPNFTPFHAS